MKRAFSLILVIGLLLGLASCGKEQVTAAPEISPERCEAYARGTTGTYEFESGEQISRIAVLVPEDMQAFLEEQAGEQSHMGLEEAEALVVEFFGADAPSNYHAYLVSGSDAVLYSLGSDEVTEAPAAAPDSEAAPPKTLAALRQEYAQMSVNLDTYEEGLAAPLSEELLALREELGDGWFLDARYLALERADAGLKTFADQYLAPLYQCGLYMEARETDSALTDEEIGLRYELELGRRDVQRELLATKEKLSALPHAEIDALIAPLKEELGEDYLEDLRFYRLCLSSEALQNYATYQRTLLAQERLLALYEEALTLPQTQSAILFEGYRKDAENRTEQYRCRVVLAAATAELDAFRQSNAETIANYETAAAAIMERYTNKDYEVDIDYLKLKIVNESLLSSLANREAAVASAEAELATAEEEGAAIAQEYQSALDAEVLRLHKAEEEPRLRNFLNTQAETLRPVEAGAAQGEAVVSEGWLEMSEAFIAEMNAARTVAEPVSADASFTSSYSGSYTGGSYGNICWEPGCTRDAVTSGDSVYCSLHSNTCASCGQYIDGDALLCMTCIAAALQ